MNIKILLGAVLIILDIGGLSEKKLPLFQHEISKAIVPTSAMNTTTRPRTPKIWVEKHDFYKGETIELFFQGGNPPFLGIIDPTGHFFYIVFPAEDALGNLKPFVDSKHFTALQALRINTCSFEADPYVYEIYNNQPVFTKSGNYTFVMGENLHVDDFGLLENVVVRYFHSIRPAGKKRGIPMPGSSSSKYAVN